MGLVKLLLFFIFVIFNSCVNTPVTNNPHKINFSVPAYEYSDFHYLPDTLYKSSFLDYHNNTIGIFKQTTIDNKIETGDPLFEIWVQTETSHNDKRVASAIIFLPPKPANGYPDSFFKPAFIPGKRFFGCFRKLNNDEFLINSLSGLITLRVNLPANYHAGIVYITNNNNQYGLGSFNLPLFSDTLLLKMFKVGNENPEDTPLAWDLKMKNIYRIPVIYINNDSFYLDINYKKNEDYYRSYPGTLVSLLQMLELDRFIDNTMIPPPDGLFDFLSNITIIPLTGDIIFPSLYPFRDKITDVNYKFEEIYSQIKSVAGNSPKSQYFHIRGYAKSAF